MVKFRADNYKLEPTFLFLEEEAIEPTTKRCLQKLDFALKGYSRMVKRIKCLDKRALSANLEKLVQRFME